MLCSHVVTARPAAMITARCMFGDSRVLRIGRVALFPAQELGNKVNFTGRSETQFSLTVV